MVPLNLISSPIFMSTEDETIDQYEKYEAMIAPVPLVSPSGSFHYIGPHRTHLFSYFRCSISLNDSLILSTHSYGHAMNISYDVK